MSQPVRKIRVHMYTVGLVLLCYFHVTNVEPEIQIMIYPLEWKGRIYNPILNKFKLAISFDAQHGSRSCLQVCPPPDFTGAFYKNLFVSKGADDRIFSDYLS